MHERQRFGLDAEHTPLVRRVVSALRHQLAAGYLWWARHSEEGPKGLHDRSHCPHTCPHATPPALWTAIPEARQRHPSWGPKKLLWLVAKRVDAPLPAPSTEAAWLKREGLVVPRRRSRTRPNAI